MTRQQHHQRLMEYTVRIETDQRGLPYVSQVETSSGRVSYASDHYPVSDQMCPMEAAYIALASLPTRAERDYALIVSATKSRTDEFRVQLDMGHYDEALAQA